MKERIFFEINEAYDLELDKIISFIKENKLKKILLQFPEGMKPYSQAIVNELESKTSSEIFIWMGTCFGACDIPVETESLGIDSIIHFGHSAWKK